MDSLNTVFRNVNGREYNIRITVPIAYEFCRLHGIKLEGLTPLALDISQLIDLAYMGSRSAKVTALGESKAEFLEGLEGEAFTMAQECAVNALVNFSLKILPKRQAEVLAAEVGRIQAASAGASPEAGSSEGQESPGSGQMS